MNSYPNPQSRFPRQVAAQYRPRHVRPARDTSWILWTVLGLAFAGVMALIAWRLQFQAKMKETEKNVSALLASADQLIQSDREDEAEAEVRKALDMLPGDARCQATIDRIDTKRKMIHQKKAAASDFAMTEAEQIAITDIAAAIASFGRIAQDQSFTTEAKRAATERVGKLKSGVCTLRLPGDWPADANLLIDDITKTPVKGVVDGIVHGKHTIRVTRYGYRNPAAMEMDFRGLEPLQLPVIGWQLWGAKVFVTSRPIGAAVWKNGKDTGKVTPCSFEDVDIGQVEFLLKHPKYSDTPLKGEVKDRKPMKLSVTLVPKAAP